jgi:hypothetical protein
MNNEFLKMQKLAGLITESEYKAELEEVLPVDYPEDIQAMEQEIQDLKAKLQALLSKSRKAKIDYTKSVPSLKDDPEYANLYLSRDKRRQYQFKELVDDLKKLSNENKNRWDVLTDYLKNKYPQTSTYTTGTNPSLHIPNFFAITKGEDEGVKSNPSKYIKIGNWYIRPW